ncbi:MAG: Crp/Fnr family transcriptional regulator [Aeromicrobium sp.]|nr:Crp/Fnr family transcriptional regulator [Burkholderiales bacterium]
MTLDKNQLIEMLPRKDRLRLLSVCEPVQLEIGKVLCEVGIPTSHVYFPINGSISLLTLIDGKPALEVGMVGREGMVGAHLALGTFDTPLQALVQGDGKSWRISADDFRREFARSPAVQRGLNKYLYVLMAQLASSATCLRFHLIGPRLARRLLMTQDRAHADQFKVTQEFLACMLGVRRVGITTAAGAMQRGGLIEYHRGNLTVLNRRGLEAAACSCYANDRQSYSRLLA